MDLSCFPRFRTNIAALDFYQTFNGAAYNSLEPDSLCHAVWVSGVEKADDGIPPVGHTELPTCPGTTVQSTNLLQLLANVSSVCVLLASLLGAHG